MAKKTETLITTTLSQEDLIKAAAAALGRKGGLIGGNARAKKLTAERRSEIAKQAAAARWGKVN